jgi:hypothetical protein
MSWSETGEVGVSTGAVSCRPRPLRLLPVPEGLNVEERGEQLHLLLRRDQADLGLRVGLALE